MDVDKWSLGTLSFGATLGIGTGEIPIPQGVDVWTAMLISTLGPALLAFVSFAARFAVTIITAYLKERSRIKQEQGQQLLDDGDASNDAKGKALLLEAAAELAAANKAEELVEKLEPKGK